MALQIEVRGCNGSKVWGGNVPRSSRESEDHVVGEDLVVNVPGKLESWSSIAVALWNVIPPESE